jgi:predicted transcriptional regulator
MAYADELIYADAIRSNGKIAEIGINCRLCERPDCPQRAVPPLDRAVIVDPWERGILPYRLG